MSLQSAGDQTLLTGNSGGEARKAERCDERCDGKFHDGLLQ